MWKLLRDSLALLSPLLPGAIQPSLVPFGSDQVSIQPPSLEYDGVVANGGAWTEAFELASEAVKKMTIEEKVMPPHPPRGPLSEPLDLPYLKVDRVGKLMMGQVNLTTALTGPCSSNSGGVPRLGIPGLCFDDGRQ